MKSREIGKSKQLYDIIVEKLLELAEHIFYTFKRRKRWTSHLTERYHIYPKFSSEEFVKDFLAARNKAIRINNYKMEVKTLACDGETNHVGKVLLMRGKKIISQATLKIKESDREDNKLIYWSFDN